MADTKKPTTESPRRLLVSMSLSEIEPKEMSEAERKDYCAAIFAAFPRIEKDIKTKMYEYLVSTYSEGVGVTRDRDERDFEVVRGNGIMEGMGILLEHWKIASSEFENTAKEKLEEKEEEEQQ